MKKKKTNPVAYVKIEEMKRGAQKFFSRVRSGIYIVSSASVS
jgi:hypothetical protein